MIIIDSGWDYYYNIEDTELVRANLVYTPYVSADGETFCMSFNRDPGYHCYSEEEVLWNDDDLTIRFYREIKFHTRASQSMPTLKVKDIDYTNRKIFLAWPGDDFLMMARTSSYEKILPDWENQWIRLIENMWHHDIIKFSLHPNSWTVVKDELVPFNWFFSYDVNELLRVSEVLMQISAERQDKLFAVLDEHGIDIDTQYRVSDLQRMGFNSFRSNYSAELINYILKLHGIQKWA